MKIVLCIKNQYKRVYATSLRALHGEGQTMGGSMSNQVALRYAVIRYMPYLETREFATVGVVAACPKTGYFDYKLTPRYSRLSHFFREFDVRIYRAVIRPD